MSEFKTFKAINKIENPIWVGSEFKYKYNNEEFIKVKIWDFSIMKNKLIGKTKIKIKEIIFQTIISIPLFLNKNKIGDITVLFEFNKEDNIINEIILDDAMIQKKMNENLSGNKEKNSEEFAVSDKPICLENNNEINSIEYNNQRNINYNQQKYNYPNQQYQNFNYPKQNLQQQQNFNYPQNANNIQQNQQYINNFQQQNSIMQQQMQQNLNYMQQQSQIFNNFQQKNLGDFQQKMGNFQQKMGNFQQKICNNFQQQQSQFQNKNFCQQFQSQQKLPRDKK